MVYSIFYYATEAITRAIVEAILKVYDWWRLRKTRLVTEKRKEEKPVPKWGFFETINPHGIREYTWVGRHTKLAISIPDLIDLKMPAYPGKPPVRLYFTFVEAASKDWFKEIEVLAEFAERAREGARKKEG